MYIHRSSALICAGVLLAALIFFEGCKKQEEVDMDTESAADHALAESIFNEINEIADQAVRDGELNTHRFGYDGNLLTSCAVITDSIDSLTGAGKVDINFGFHYCLGVDHKY